MSRQYRADGAPASLRSYATGFGLSLALTLLAYVLVVNKVVDSRLALAAIISLAVTQLLVQLMFFLHLGRESRPHWNLIMVLFAVMVVVIVVFGSLWIMNNLNYNMMSPEQTDAHILGDEGIKKTH
jgi:cytochrome o ubiquinol oxidase operon protein cyoD